MSFRKLIVVAIVVAAAYYLYTHRAGAPGAASAGRSASAAGGSPSSESLSKTERADRAVSDAAALVSRPPVDAAAWQSAESNALSAISAAESACNAADLKDRDGVAELRAALTSMRSLMTDLSAAAKGTGGATEGARMMEDIENHLDKARSLLH
jgi:hypothetical protein